MPGFVFGPGGTKHQGASSHSGRRGSCKSRDMYKGQQTGRGEWMESKLYHKRVRQAFLEELNLNMQGIKEDQEYLTAVMKLYKYDVL